MSTDVTIVYVQPSTYIYTERDTNTETGIRCIYGVSVTLTF